MSALIEVVSYSLEHRVLQYPAANIHDTVGQARRFSGVKAVRGNLMSPVTQLDDFLVDSAVLFLTVSKQVRTLMAELTGDWSVVSCGGKGGEHSSRRDPLSLGLRSGSGTMLR